ncbi:MAG TPA: SRPBCC domain-containing protein, partial [Steroidobacteraceae bacterium]
EQVWSFITDPQKVAQCIPGCEGAEEKERGKYAAAINVKVGPIRTTFHLDIEQTEQRPPEFASYQGKGEEGSRASRISSVSTLALKSLSVNSTQVTYTSDINITGRLGKFGGGMMQKIADGIGEEFVAALRGRLQSPAVTEAVPAVLEVAPGMPVAVPEVPGATPEVPQAAPGISEATLGVSEAAPPARREIAVGANWIWWAAGVGLGIAALLWWLL